MTPSVKQEAERRYPLPPIESENNVQARLQSAFIAGYEFGHGWIRVEDGLPEFDGRYLCFVEQTQECGNTWEYEDVRVMFMNAWKKKANETITHWMPLPPPPAERKEEK